MTADMMNPRSLVEKTPVDLLREMIDQPGLPESAATKAVSYTTL